MLKTVTIKSSLLAFACAASLSAHAVADTSKAVEIPAGDLRQALLQASEHFNAEIVYSPEQVEGLKTGGVHGELTTQQAITKLLEGTPLELRIDASGAMLIARPGAARVPQTSGNHAQGKLSWSRLQLAQAQGPGGPTQRAAATEERTQSQEKFEVDEIIVTGTRLQTTQDAVASPAIVITREDIKKQGLSTVEDVVRSLSQNFSTINAAAGLDSSINGQLARGQSAANLRGLGPENTLILVNGRRRAASAGLSGGIVNLNTIPAGAIERVEIITDGASAIYGSDAVAGVINFILRKDYEGAETRVRQEFSNNDGDAFSVDQLLGANWSTGNVTASAHYATNDGVNSRKAGVTTWDLRSLGGTDQRTVWSSQPGITDLGSLPANDDGTNGIAGRLSPDNAASYDGAPYERLSTSDSRSLSFDVNAEQQLGAHANLYAELTYSTNKSDSPSGLPEVAFEDVPVTNRFNDTGATVTGVGYVFVNEYLNGLIPAYKFSNDQKALGGTLGVKFDLPFADWTMDVSGGHAKEEGDFWGNGIDNTLLAQRVSGLDADGNPLPADQHLNLFGNGTAQDPAALAGLMAERPGLTGTDASTMNNGLVTAEGALARLPGGTARLALGAELRDEKLDYQSSRSVASFLIVTDPAREVKAGFAEATLPIVGERNRIAGIYSLNLSVAARYEEYTISGPFDGPTNPEREATFSRTSPKYGISWRVAPSIKLRATLSDSFRAPQLNHMFRTGSGPSRFLPIIDPANPQDGLIRPDVYFSGNPSLKPEISDNFTAGVDWTPKNFLQGLSVSATYGKIDFTNRISSTTRIAFDNPDLLFTIPGLVERTADGHISRITLMSVNLAARHSETVDVNATYDFSTAVGDITLGFAGTHTIKLDDVTAPGADALELAGTEAGPEKRKWRTWIGWSAGEYGANLYANYSGSYTNVNDPAGTPRPPQPVDSYTTYDLTGYYRIDRLGWSLNGGVRNLTDAKAPFFNGFGTPWDPRRVDTRGRVVYLEISKKYGLRPQR